MAVKILTPTNLGRGFAVGGVTPDKVELDLGAGLAFVGNQVTPVAKHCLFVRRTTAQALSSGVDLLFNSASIANGISYAAATGVASVPAAAGVVWRVTLVVHLNNITTNTATIALVDAANTLLYPDAQLVAFAAPSTVQAAGSTALDLLYTSATAWTVKARCTNGGGNLRADALCGLIIQEL